MVELNYERPEPARMEERFYTILLKLGVGYCILSSLTLPLLDTVWMGEVPLMALVQIPKIALASWLRTGPVMWAIRELGWSRGSFSPDYTMARIAALGLAYLIPLSLLLPLWLRMEKGRPVRRWAVALLVAAAIDFLMTLLFASQRGITIY